MPAQSTSLLPLRPSISEYSDIQVSKGLYVDKTAEISAFLESDFHPDATPSFRFVFLARPPRFGMTLTDSTLEAYFQGIANPNTGTEQTSNPLRRYPNLDRWTREAWLPAIHQDLINSRGKTCQ